MTEETDTQTIYIDTGAGTPADWDVVLQGMLAYNREKADLAGEPLAALARNDEGDALGGLVGFTQGGWLYIELFWLPEELRNQGLGSALLADAEAEALRRGCANVHLDSFSFQTRDFYARRGYEPFGRLADYPVGHTRTFYQKRLRP